MWSHKFLIQELVSAGVTGVQALGSLMSWWFVEDTEGGLGAAEAIGSDDIYQMFEGDTAPEQLDKCTGESLGQTEKAGYFPKSSEEFFNWRKSRVGWTPSLPAHLVISCKPCFAIQQVSWLLGWTSPIGFIPGPGRAIFLPSHLHEPAPPCQHTQSFSQGFSPLSRPLLPGCLPSLAVPAEVAPIPLVGPLPQSDIQEGTSKQLSPASAQTCLFM